MNKDYVFKSASKEESEAVIEKLKTKFFKNNPDKTIDDYDKMIRLGVSELQEFISKSQPISKKESDEK